MPYIGGKSSAGVWQRIVNLIPPHGRFVELFAGGAAITKLKRPAAVNLCVEKSQRQVDTLNRELPAGAVAVVGCGIEYAEREQWLPDDLIYADPPYVLSTRNGRRYYEYEMSDADHVRLLRALLTVGCRVILSGYASELYAAEGFGMFHTLPGWSCETFTAYTRSHRPATECLWFNYPRPETLHDLSHVGENFRERWRIEKRRRRWRARLAKMPALERESLFSVLSELMTSTSAVAGASRAAPGVALGSGNAGNGVSSSGP